MAISEYVLLVSLSAGIPAHADTHGISIGPNVATQSNGGAPVASTRVAALRQHIESGACPEYLLKPLSTGRVSSSSGSHGTQSFSSGNPVRPPAIRTPAIRVR